tara:strand:+ start:1646 stop:2758 length:1113 start_codon:yes stop_codon:yes gene_type:complete
MKVLMVAPSVRVPDTLGQTLHQLALANGLAKRGIQVTLLCRYDSSKDGKDFNSNLKFLSINDPKIPFERLIFTYNSYKSALKELKSNNYDLVHDRGYIFAGSGVRAARECGVKSILQVDDNWIRSERSATKFANYWLYNKKAIESCHNQIENANGGFTVSAVLRAQITKWNLKAQNFDVIQNGYEKDLFIPEVEPLGIKKKLGIKGKLAIFVGALGPWHGIDEISSIAIANPSINVVVAGGGYGNNLPTVENLHHIGRLGRSEVPRLLVEADVGLAPYPNLDYGFSPLKIYEYMGCKLPVFATDLPSVREATEGHAFLAKPGKLSSLVSRFINNEKALNKVTELAYNYATKRRTWDNTIDETIELYQKIL